MMNILRMILKAVGFLALCAAILAGLVFLAWYHVMHVSAKDAYARHFATPIGLAHRLKGSGVSWMGHDEQVRFESDESPRLTDDDKFSVGCDTAAAGQFFVKYFPGDRASLEDTENSACRSHNKYGNGETLEELYVENTKTKVRFFSSKYAH